MSGCNAKNTISELVLAAVFYLQQRNGVSVMEVAEYIGEKHCCNPCKISRQIKVALNKAKEHGIMSESKGKYRIEGKYEDKLEKDELKPPKNGDEDEEGNDNDKDDPCKGFEFEGDAENGHKHKHGEGEGRANGDGKLEDSVRDPNVAEEDEYRGRDLAEPLSKRRKIYLKRDIYDYSEFDDEDEDEDSETCVLDELRDFERRK